MLGSFTRRLEWLERVALDPDCRGLPTAVAALLAARYFNSKTGRAWPATATLAERLTADRRSVQRAFDLLVAAGHLERELGGGRRRTNSYWMRQKGGAAAALDAEKGRRPRPEKAASTPRKERRPRRPNLGNTPGTTRGRPAPPQTSLPDKWELGPAEFTVAQRLAGWDPERAREEFEHFRAYHRTKGAGSADWAASWEVWCRNGAKFDQGSKRGSSRSALRGLQRWVARQNDSETEQS